VPVASRPLRDRAPGKLQPSGMADVVETPLRQSQGESLAPFDLVSTLVSDQLLHRQGQLFARHTKHGSRSVWWPAQSGRGRGRRELSFPRGGG
jgi:hypothetical protein